MHRSCLSKISDWPPSDCGRGFGNDVFNDLTHWVSVDVHPGPKGQSVVLDLSGINGSVVAVRFIFALR